ncbi:MAG: arginine repressor [Clostridia bacterium]|nr:arginine repressor [Clostridia bacterium]
MKASRQDAILELVERYEIETQDDLIERLRQNGFEVTQATVSRDIRELKLTKVLTGHGGYRYVLPPKESGMTGNRLNRALLESIVMIDVAMNIVVIKTHPGLAPAVAAGLDSLHIPEIVGCVAGDDTLINVTRDVESAEIVCEKLKELVKSN